MQAKIEIRIWSDGKQPDTQELGEMFTPHAEHVASMLAQGFTSGEICGDHFRGWWDIVTTEEQPTKAALLEALRQCVILRVERGDKLIGRRCSLCDSRWRGKAEKHRPYCIAAQ